jgi:prolyl-tRNA editing enzyme YbaK/EbsC (Cys-tRNA(Pro) deacylase)
VEAKEEYPVWIDETAQAFEVISVSVGVRRNQVSTYPATAREK